MAPETKKHIALFIMSLQPGGAERVLTNLANYWSQKGHKITLVTLSAPSEKPFYPLDKNVQLLQLNRMVQNPKLQQSRLVHWLIQKPWCRRVLKLQAIFRLRQTIQALQPDVIVSFIDLMNITVLLTSKGLKIPIFVSERIDPNHHQIFFLLKILRHISYKWASQIIVQTHSAAQYFQKPLAEKIQIIPNPIQKAPPITNQNGEAVQHIITVGRLAPQKDHKTLIQAFAIAQKQFPDLRLTIYGEGKERRSLEKLIQTLKLEGSVNLPGVINDLETAWGKTDLFLFPSRYEGFPNALAEAMSRGLPVIASNASGNTDLVHDKLNGRLFAVGDTEALAGLICELSQDHSQRQRLSRAATKVSQTFSEDKIWTCWDRLIV